MKLISNCWFILPLTINMDKRDFLHLVEYFAKNYRLSDIIDPYRFEELYKRDIGNSPRQLMYVDVLRSKTLKYLREEIRVLRVRPAKEEKEKVIIRPAERPKEEIRVIKVRPSEEKEEKVRIIRIEEKPKETVVRVRPREEKMREFLRRPSTRERIVKFFKRLLRRK